MNQNLINFFKSALNNLPQVDPIELNKKSMKCGYIVHPDCCNSLTSAFIDDIDCDYNSTFYKTWEDVTSKSRLDILVDQLIHYASTYGTDFQGQPYIPNDGCYEIDYNKYTVINPISPQELFDKCKDILYSGIALHKNTLNPICEYIIDNYTDGCLDINCVKNRDAIVILCKALNVYPSDPQSLFKLIYYTITGNPMVIKDKNSILMMSHCDKFDWFKLTETELISLASVFNRYKSLFLAVKKLGKYNYVINKISKLSKKHHNHPFITPFWNKVLSKTNNIELIQYKAKELSNFRLVSLINTINYRLCVASECDAKCMHIIRNGKIYINDPKYTYDKTAYYILIKKVLIDQLISNLKSKACVVKFPIGLNLMCPMSEKQFVGNIPYGSYYEFDKHNYIGIYWRNEWGAKDFDLSFISLNGCKYGWNSRFTDPVNSIIYSGDMTNADPEATELLYCAKNCPNGIIKVNRYNGEVGSKFKIFFGNQHITDMRHNYMVDPNTVKFESMMESDGREGSICYINDNKAYFIYLHTSNDMVSSTMNKEYMKCIERKLDTYVDLKSILLSAGFEEYDSTKHNKIDLDLSDLKKDTLITLFSKEE
jgi:hypothetical protein